MYYNNNKNVYVVWSLGHSTNTTEIIIRSTEQFVLCILNFCSFFSLSTLSVSFSHIFFLGSKFHSAMGSGFEPNFLCTVIFRFHFRWYWIQSTVCTIAYIWPLCHYIGDFCQWWIYTANKIQYSHINPVANLGDSFNFNFNSIWWSNFVYIFKANSAYNYCLIRPKLQALFEFVGYLVFSFVIYVASHIQLTCDWCLICHHLHRFIRISEINTTRNARIKKIHVQISSKPLPERDGEKNQKCFENHLSVCLLIFVFFCLNIFKYFQLLKSESFNFKVNRKFFYWRYKVYAHKNGKKSIYACHYTLVWLML